jgi:hypothetical protein
MTSHLRTIYSLTDPSHTAKQKTYFHDTDMEYFRNNIICVSFYQRYCLILPSPSKLKHDFPHVMSSISVIVVQSELPSLNL